MKISVTGLEKLGKVFGVAFVILSVTGCAGMVAKEVSDEQRDTTGKFDGMWAGKIDDGGGIQYVGSQGMRCHPLKRTIRMRIVGGTLVVYSGMLTPNKTVNVDADGKFRLEVPTNHKYSGGSFNVQKPEITYVLQGELSGDWGDGLFVAGMQQLNNQGCSHRVAFKRA